MNETQERQVVEADEYAEYELRQAIVLARYFFGKRLVRKIFEEEMNRA